MKLKAWLLLSYFIIMVVPLLVAYLLYAWVQTYNNELKVVDYFEVSAELEVLKTLVNDPAFYETAAERETVVKLANEQQSITLYNADGPVIYSSNPTAVAIHSGLGKETLYTTLFDFNQGYCSYTYKKPVFNGQQLVVVFEIAFSRNEWVTGVSNWRWFTLAGKRSKLTTTETIHHYLR